MISTGPPEHQFLKYKLITKIPQVANTPRLVAKPQCCRVAAIPMESPCLRGSTKDLRKLQIQNNWGDL